MPFKRYLTDEQRKINTRESYRRWKKKSGYVWRKKFPERALESKLRSKAEGRETDRTDYKRAWGQRNRDKTTQACYRWLAKNPEYLKEYNLKNKNRIAENRRKRCKERKQTDPGYRILLALRRRIATALERAKTKKTLNTKSVLGCDIYSFVRYIESKWEPGMDWSNHGSAWHLDHIIPCAAFDLSKDEHKRYCFHFSNYQPLWSEPNLKKSANLPEGFNLTEFLSTPLPEAQPNKASQDAQLGTGQVTLAN